MKKLLTVLFTIASFSCRASFNITCEVALGNTEITMTIQELNEDQAEVMWFVADSDDAVAIFDVCNLTTVLNDDDKVYFCEKGTTAYSLNFQYSAEKKSGKISLLGATAVHKNFICEDLSK